MASPIDKNPSLAGSIGSRTIGSNAPNTSALNIPNDSQNYHWFLSENTGSRTPISFSNVMPNGITAALGIDAIANRILSHLGA